MSQNQKDNAGVMERQKAIGCFELKSLGFSF